MDHAESSESAPLLDQNQENNHEVEHGPTTPPTKKVPQWRRILTYTIVPIISATFALLNPIMLLLVPITLIPTITAYWIYQAHTTNSPHRINTSSLAGIYFIFGLVGILIVLTISSIASYAVAFVLFRSDTKLYLDEMGRTETSVEQATPDILARRAEMASRWQYWAFMLILTFGVIAFTEELFKYWSLPLGMKYLGLKTDAAATTTTIGSSSLVSSAKNPTLEYKYIPIIVAATLGFSTLENIGFLYGAAVASREPPLRLLLTTCERLLISSTGHVLNALVIAIACIRRDFRAAAINNTFFNVLLLPILMHGSFDFVLFAASALGGNIGWVHPRSGLTLVGIVVIIVGLEIALALVVGTWWRRYDIRLG